MSDDSKDILKSLLHHESALTSLYNLLLEDNDLKEKIEDIINNNINNNIELNINNNELKINNNDEKTAKIRLKELLDKEENKVCADCSSINPTWASTNLGVFLCTQCSGVHRSLGVHISAMLSCRLDDWTDNQVDHMIRQGGNKKINLKYEYHVPDCFPKPHADDNREYRERYIREKYVACRFCKRERKPPRQRLDPNEPILQLPPLSSELFSSPNISSSQQIENITKDISLNPERHKKKKKGLIKRAIRKVAKKRNKLLNKEKSINTNSNNNIDVGLMNDLDISDSRGSVLGMVEYLGVITIQLINGRDLLAMDINGNTSNPQVCFRLGNQEVYSKVVEHTLHPQWYENLLLCWDGVEDLIADVYSDNEHMGRGVVDLTSIVDIEEMARRDSDEPFEATSDIIYVPLSDRNLTTSTKISNDGIDDRLIENNNFGAMKTSGEKQDKVSKKSGIKGSLRRLGRGSLFFGSRDATGGLNLQISFSELSH